MSFQSALVASNCYDEILQEKSVILSHVFVVALQMLRQQMAMWQFPLTTFKENND